MVLYLLSLTNNSSLREDISNVAIKMWLFLTVKKVVDVLTDDILVVPSGSNEQTNSKKFEDSDGTINSGEF